MTIQQLNQRLPLHCHPVQVRWRLGRATRSCGPGGKGLAAAGSLPVQAAAHGAQATLGNGREPPAVSRAGAAVPVPGAGSPPRAGRLLEPL